MLTMILTAILSAVEPATLPSSVPADLDLPQAIAMLLSSLGGLKGAGALGIAVVVTQAVMLFFRTPLAKFAGKWRLAIVAGVSVVSTVIALKATGLDFLACLVHAGTITSLQVFGNQLVKQFSEKADTGSGGTT